MAPPAPAELLARIAALPAAVPLFERLARAPGVYLVGGAVRDLLRGERPVDLDFAVEGDAVAFARELGGERREHDRFGTATVRLADREYDFATARRERYLRPGALPDVAPAGIEADLGRRDFTVNALAVSLAGPRAGELLTVPEALGDLAAGRLRTLHGGSFRDDPTRLFRLARYGARLGFTPEPATEAQARAAIAHGALATISGPRIGHELRLLAGESHPIGGFAELRRLGLDTAVHPGFGIDDAELAERAFGLLPADGRRDLLALALAARAVPAAERAALLERLGVHGGERDTVLTAVAAARRLAGELEQAVSPAAVAAALDAASVEAVALAGALGPARAAESWLRVGRRTRLLIAGADLLEAGIPPGPAVGRGLRAALAAKRDGMALDRAGELAVALAAARAESS